MRTVVSTRHKFQRLQSTIDRLIDLSLKTEPSYTYLMNSSPPRVRGSVLALIAVFIISGLIFLSLFQLVTAALSPFLVLWVIIPLVSFPLLLLILYRWYGLLSATYRINRDGFYLKWGLAFEQVPLSSVQSIERSDSDEIPLRPGIGFWWPGCIVGRKEFPEIGVVDFFTAKFGESMLLVNIENRIFAISPRDPDAFELAFQSAARMGSLETVPKISRRSNFVFSQLWSDMWARILILVGALFPLIIFGYIAMILPGLPFEVPFGFAPSGIPDTFGSPGRLLLLPMVAGFCWFIDLVGGMWLYRGEDQRPLAYVLWSAAILVGGLFAGATIHLLTAA